MNDYKDLDKRAIKIMQLNALILSVIGTILVIIGFYLLNKSDLENYLIIIGNVALIFIQINLVLDVFLFPIIRYKRYKYLINEDRVDVKEGLFRITRTIIPIKRVQKIEISHGPIDRLFKLANIQIFTAAGILKIKFLDEHEAETITFEIKKILEKIGK